MSTPDHWVYAPKMAANLTRQFHRASDAAALLAPLQKNAAEAQRITRLREAMFRGEIVNETEHRGAGHWALRLACRDRQPIANAWPGQAFAPTGEDLMPRIRDVHRQSCDLADGIRSGRLQSSSNKRYRHIVHLGIGGSDIGPQLLIDSLKHWSHGSPLMPVFLSNLDYHAVAHAISDLDPRATLVVIASKSFTTQETMHNASHLLRWMEGAGIDSPKDHFIAVTSRTDRAREWGIAEDRVLWFDESIGGRFSLWGPVSITARMVLGNDVMDAFIDGGLQMDEHFLTAALNANLPATLAAADFYNLRQRGLPTLMVSAYDSRLELLVPYLKQLWMESLGKRVDRQGKVLAGPACPILWGDVGTNAQHAFFQLLHQGQQGVAIELIGVVSPEHEAIDSHHALLANLIAQAQALSCGHDDAIAAKSCRGGHPISLLMLDRFDAATLGALIALWEHRVLCMAALADINPFDQWGVELGKSIAPSALAELSIENIATGKTALDDTSRAIITWLRARR